MKTFKVNDRVTRVFAKKTVEGVEQPTVTSAYKGCIGTVKAVREETTLAARESKEKSMMFHVLWDSGTLSYLGPEGLALA